MGLRIGISILVFVACFVSMESAFLANQPKWNWEEVILSRNGPSTTTTPRPKFWKTTTLRSIDIPAVRGEGSVGTFEDAILIPLKLRFERDLGSGVGCVTASKLFVALAAAAAVVARLA